MNADEFKSRGGGARKILLFVVLLAVLAMLGYDYLVCQPAFKEAQTQAEQILNPKLDENENAVINANTGTITKRGDLDGDGVVSPDDVHKFLEREPANVDAEFTKSTVLETYSWPRGVPFMSQQIFAEYSKSQDEEGKERLSLFKVHMTQPESGGTKYVPVAKEDRPEGLGASLGGGVPNTAPDDSGDDEGTSADEAGADDEGAGDESAGDEGADEDGAGDEGADEDGADEDGADEDAGSGGNA